MVDDRITVALDAMGGDNAPYATVKGAVDAVNAEQGIRVFLYGKPDLINKELEKYTYSPEQIEVKEANETIEPDDHPVKAIRTKRHSSMVEAVYAVKNEEADAVVSCGNTGALLVAGQTIVGKLKGVERPGLGFIVPTRGNPTLILDCGASVDAKAHMLLQYAQMGDIYMRDVVGVSNPRVGIINIGEEEEKGNSLVKEAFPLLRACETINFVGSVETRQLTEGAADVVVCDAFVGNSILKMYEGVATALLAEIKGALMSSFKSKIGALLIKKNLKKTLKKFDIEEYGGAPMLGLKKLVVKPHGSSGPAEIRNAVIQCKAFVKADVPGKIAARMEVQAEV